MPLYRYTAIDQQGRRSRGQLEASSEAALEAGLRKAGQWVTEVRERAARSPESIRTRGNHPASRRVLIEFFLQIGLQLRSGVNLIDALRFGLDDQRNSKFREVQADVVERVQAGAAFSEALGAHPRTFAPLVLNLIRAGESSGRLAETCADIRRYYEWLDRLMADIRQALLYPSIVLVAVVLFFFLVFTFLIPRFTQVLIEIKVKLPWLTQAFVNISKFVNSHGWLIGGSMLLAVLVVKLGPRLSPGLALVVDAVKLRVPIFGSIHHLICLSRVAQNLATLYRAGIPLLASLELCRSLSGNKLLEDAMGTVELAVNAGRPMHEAMRENSLFSRLMVQMVAVGENTGTLGDSLQHVADYYNEVVPRQVKKLLSILEPLIIVGLIIMVGAVALAVFLPIVAMFDAK